MDRGTVTLPMDEIIEHAQRNDLYLLFRIDRPGSDVSSQVAAIRHAADVMQRDLPQVGPGYMNSVSRQNTYLSVEGPILNLGIYDARDVPTAIPRLAESLELTGWSGRIELVDSSTAYSASYLADDRDRPLVATSEETFSVPRPPVAAPLPGGVVVDEARIEHSWQEGMDYHYGWLRLHCSAEQVSAAAVAMANGIAAVAARINANISNPMHADYLEIGPVQVSALGPFVELADIWDFPKLRQLITALGAYLEDDGVEGVLTILDFREGRP